MKSLLAKIVSIYSVSGDEHELAQYILSYLSSAGLRAYDVGKDCIVTHITGINNTRAIIINGHIDTVPPGNEQHWDGDPLALSIHGDKAVGLGTSDMKSGLVVMLELAKYYSVNPPSVDLYFVFTPGEEIDGRGMREFTDYFQEKQSLYTTVSALVLEPTNLEFIGVGHRGNVMCEVVVSGQSGHGSRPEEINKHAILDAFNLISKIEKLEKRWIKSYSDKVTGSPSIAISAISSGDQESPNKFPSICRITIDIRTTESLHNLALPQLVKIVQASGATISEIAEASPPATVSVNNWITLAAKRVLQKPLKSFPGATDLSFLSRIDIEGIIYGPGAIDQMHIPNEYVLIPNLKQCSEDIKKIIKSC